MNDFTNEKNIIKFLKQKYGNVKSYSDIGQENFKRAVKKEYEIPEIKTIKRKIDLRFYKSFSNNGSDYFGPLFGAFIAFVFTVFVTIVTMMYSLILNDTNLKFKIHLPYIDDLQEKENKINEVKTILQDGAGELMFIVIAAGIVLFIFLAIIITVTFLNFHSKKLEAYMYDKLLTECINELEDSKSKSK